ncbi:unnamed protein product [Rotaria sordida]|uniref:ubiquitinyl hydrolase 1 n=1 Tax=Rotaria sordida TaxID=392033 RepID=A0A815EAE7_9BILA|nr:unnamed protein product [Rotaria sordida]
MNITIREIQVDVARHMMQLSPNDTQVRNIVMQMNMGEGKTSVIIPMLALSLCSPLSSLVRVVVLKSLFHMNYQSLRFKLGGLLNRRIFSFACRRNMDFNHIQVNQIFDRLQQGLRRCDIILVSPEAILSFDLLMIDKCRRHEFDTARSMLIVQRWLKTFARDVLDESDEILHCKYQLIYTVGAQQQVDGGVERWKLIQLILNSVRKFATDIAQSDPDDSCYKSPKCKSAFPEFRLLSHQPYAKLSAKIVHDWLNQKSYRKTDKQTILSFIFDMNTSVDALVHRFSSNDIQSFLIIRGLLSTEVLLVALKKRYRVHYGVNSHTSFNRLMAVPFRAKDVPAERTEFGHPDIALVLTQLSYYYSGLNDSQMIQCFNRLSEEERDPESIYDEWISQEDENDVPQIYFGYAIGILIIDFNPQVNGSAESSSPNESDTSATSVMSTLDQPVISSPLINRLYLGFAVVHLISAFLYWWAWAGRSWLDVIMIPEYLNHIEAGLYLWSAIWYSREDTLGGYYTLSVHKIELAAAIVELFASFGWIMSWYMTYIRTLGRGFTLDDPDVIAYSCTTISSIVYLVYNIQINVKPELYGTYYLFTYGDIVYFVGACYYIFASLRDDHWFWFLPLAGQYGVAPGRVHVETKNLPQLGKPMVLITDVCRRRIRKVEPTESKAVDLVMVSYL